MSQKALRFISYVFILLWGLAFFVGYNYAKAGDYFVSAIVTVIALIFMGGVFFFMLRLNDAPIDALGVKGSQTLKWLMIALYAAISLFMAVYINHMGIVSATDKTDIQDKVKKEIQELQTTFDFNEDVPAPNSYYKWVTEQLAIFEDSLKTIPSTSIEAEKIAMEDRLMEDSGFSALSLKVNASLKQVWKAVNSWNIFTVVHQIGILQGNKSAWEREVEKCSLYADAISDESFKCTSEHNYSNLLDGIVNVSRRPSLLAIILMLVIQFFILLSFFASLPKNKSVNGFKTKKAERDGRVEKGAIRSWSGNKKDDWPSEHFRL